ncbi:MAG: methyltransferase family protein [Anaerolineaceae bacterium]
MTNEAAHQKGWQIFEVVVGLPFLAAIGLQLGLPIPFPSTRLVPIILIVGVVLIVAGVLLVSLARREFARLDQPTDPGLMTNKIITTDVFSFSRNPLYLGGFLFLTGIALVFRITWALILLVPAGVACHIILIMPEEKYLAARFGGQYLEYMATVHRWIGRK